MKNANMQRILRTLFIEIRNCNVPSGEIKGSIPAGAFTRYSLYVLGKLQKFLGRVNTVYSNNPIKPFAFHDYSVPLGG